MNTRRIFTIFQKDLRDAIRDARVLVALIVPLAIGIFYNFAFEEDEANVSANVVVTSPDQSTLPVDLTQLVGTTIDLRFLVVGSADEVRATVRDDDSADLGIIIPAGFDADVRAGRQPRLEIVHPATTTFAGDYVTASIEPALRIMAGQQPPVQLDIQAVAEPTENDSAIDKVGLRTWSMLAAIVMMVAMIAMLAVPVILAEEQDRKTLDALVLVSNYREVVLAKALVGLFYIAVMVPLLLFLTQSLPEQIPLFAATVVLLSIALIGGGLLMAGIFKNANQLNTWSGIVLIPVILPAFVIGVPAPDVVGTIAQLLPSGAATRLLMNASSTERVFSGQAFSFAVIAAWGVLGYGLLLWQLSRRQA